MKATRDINSMKYYELVSCSRENLIEEINDEFVCILFRNETRAINWIESNYPVDNIKIKEYEEL